MYELLGSVLTWLFFWGATAAVLMIDDRRAKAQAKKAGTVDFAERRIRAYLAAAFFLGALVLILYFWSTRRSARGALLGAGALVAVTLATVLVSAVLSVVAHAGAAHTCAGVVAGTDADECTTSAFRYPDRAALLETGCKAGGVSPCLERDELEGSSRLFGDPLAPASVWLQRARTLCAARPANVPRGRCEVVDPPH